MNLPFLPIEIKTESPLFRKALTLARYGRRAAYEQLEFLGDRVLGLIVAEMLYRHFKYENEGDWAMRFTLLVREETLAYLAKQINLSSYLITKDEGLRDNDSILADVMEAIIAAIYLDQGLDKAKLFVESLWTPLLDRSHETIKDAKSALQEWSQLHTQTLPKYELISRTGPDHAPFFIVSVMIDKYGSATGEGTSKKEAMQHAAKQLLNTLSQITVGIPKKRSKK